MMMITKKKIKNFYLHTRFYLSLYSVTGDLLKRSKMEESSLFESNTALSALITIKPSFAEIKGPLQTLSFKAGQEYVSKFLPQNGSGIKEQSMLARFLKNPISI